MKTVLVELLKLALRLVSPSGFVAKLVSILLSALGGATAGAQLAGTDLGSTSSWLFGILSALFVALVHAVKAL